LSLAIPARAQIGVSLSAETDYRYHGVSLTGGKPDLSLNLSYDHGSGLYAGASAIGTQGPRGDVRALGFVEYVGFVARTGAETAWDAGVNHSNLTVDVIRPYTYDYSEYYVGLLKNNYSFHLYYSPNYLGQGVNTIYADLDGAVRPAAHWRLFAHAGVLTSTGGGRAPDGRQERYDVRAGVAAEFGGGEVRLAWTAISPYAEYPAGRMQSRDALVLGASYYF